MNLKNSKIGIIGLGYVGLPLAVEFSKKQTVIGFDLDQIRIDDLKNGLDLTLEVSPAELGTQNQIKFTSDVVDLKDCDVFIVTVPTPVDESNQPDLRLLVKASEDIASIMKPLSVVIYESTVYPGVTEEICVPILERISGLRLNIDFFCGYSPERVSPGDKLKKLTTVVKITSGSNEKVAIAIDELYGSIIKAGTFRVSSIKIAEAAKVIENTQRDLNIALINELSLIFHRLEIDTLSVLEAASTKWNFIPFKPGLVGGHCIGVDPYYLAYKAQQKGYHPEVILAGRRVNDNVVEHIAHETIRLMLKRGLQVAGSNILVLGVTFKENCPDIRNSKIVPLCKLLSEYNTKVDIYDPWANIIKVKNEYGLDILNYPPDKNKYSGIIIAVGHKEFLDMGIDEIKSFGNGNCVVFDVKGLFPLEKIDLRL